MTETPKHRKPLEFLAEQRAANDDDFEALLAASLAKAKELAAAQLKPALYEALAWPTDWTTYNEYLDDFMEWAPQQSDSEAWRRPGHYDQNQEVYDRLCHFYWLIDQPVGPDGTIIIQNIPWFSDFLVLFALYWGSFLDTTESFSDEILETFIKYSPQYRVEDSMITGKDCDGNEQETRPNNPSGWLTFNQFFARELNPGLRPISSPCDNTVVAMPADCTYKAQYAIAADSTIPEIVVKSTHKYASIEDLLKGSRYASAFANGTFVHYFLGPYSYHRFHAPAGGRVVECYPCRGKVYLDVQISGDQFDAPDSAEGGYEFSQARGVITLDTTGSEFGNVGVIAVIPVGMCQVSSVNMMATVGQNLLKGEEFGYFMFGGSDIIVLFQQGTNPQIDTSTDYRLYGTTLATCTPLG